MFTIDLASRGEGDIGLARRSMVRKPSDAASASAGGSKSSSQTEVIDLVSDGENEEAEDSFGGDDGDEDDDDDDDVEVLVEGNRSAPMSDCILVDRPHAKGRDINDNNGSEGMEKQRSMFERRSYQSDRHIPAGVPSELLGTGASFSRLSIYRRKSIHMSPEPKTPLCRSPTAASRGASRSETSPKTNTTSGIILNRAYNKTPSTTGTSTVDHLVPETPAMQPVICLDDIQDRLSFSDTGYNVPWHNLHGNERARSSMSKSSRTSAPGLTFLRRSFHKVTTLPSRILTIDLEQDRPLLDDIETTSPPTAARCANVRKPPTASPTSPTVLVDLDAQPTVEGMDVTEVEDISFQPVVSVSTPLSSTSSSSSSGNVAVVHEVPGPESQEQTSPLEMRETVAEQPFPIDPDEEADDGAVSSMYNSYGDVSSMGCLKKTSHRGSVGYRQGVEIGTDGKQALNEFDLLLLKINQTMPPMSQKDRIDQWRVTAADLLHSIPTKAAIETTSTCAKRPLHDTVHVSSDDDSDNLDAGTAAGGPCTRGNKKRRTLEGEGDQSEASTHALDDDELQRSKADRLDFRKSQINPEIDKPPQTGTILERRNYHKLPSRYREHPCCSTAANHQEDRERSCQCTAQQTSACSPLTPVGGASLGTTLCAHLLKRDLVRDKFLSYLEISPFFRTDEKARAPSERPSSHNEAMVDLKTDINMKLADIRLKINRLKPCLALGTKQRVKEKRKKPPKSKAHPSVIASSGLRGVRRLVLSSSLRSGKVIRYRNNILTTLAKPKPRLATAARLSDLKKDHDDSRKADTPEKNDKQPSATGMSTRSASVASTGENTPVENVTNARQQRLLRRSESAAARSLHQPPVSSPVPSTSSLGGHKSSKGRCSVDSAVSSSTSAEMRLVEKQSKECQTMDVVIDQPESLPSPVPTNDGKRLRNPLARADGEVLHMFLCDEQLIVIQKERVSFWKYSRLGVLLGVKQDWQRVSQIQRWSRDTEVDTHNSNRIVYNQTNPVYLEPRARDLNDDKSRACPLASIYVNAYFLDMPSNVLPTASMKPSGTVDDADGTARTDSSEAGDDAASSNDELLRMKSYQLDTVKSALDDIRLVPLPNARDFIVCWHDHVSEMESRTGLCKYSLTPDLDSLGCIREFAVVKQRLRSLRSMNDRKLLGLGQSTVHIWCFESGYLLRTVDLKIDLGLIVCAFLHIEANESTLIMLQLQQPPEPDGSNNRKVVKVIAVNLYKPSWYIAHSYEIALSSMSMTGESAIWRMDASDASARHCVTFDSGELLLVSLADPTACWTNHKRLEKELQRAETGAVNICSRLRSSGSNEMYRPRERILNVSGWNGGRDLVFLSEQLLITKTIDEYIMERAKDR